MLFARHAVLAGALVFLMALGFAGCGTPGAPQPPSLNLPERVVDLSAVRAGATVTLRWTMPRKTTDHVLLETPIVVRVCRADRPVTAKGALEVCNRVGTVSLLPGATGTFEDSLPLELRAGQPWQTHYAVELMNKAGHSAGLSNAAIVLAGTAPARIEGLSAEVRPDGVALRWQGGEQTAVRLHRQLLSPTVKSAQGSTLMQAPPESPTRTLLVDGTDQTGGGPDKAIDSSVRFGNTYEYKAQRIQRVNLDGKVYELAGELSIPLRVEVIDTFPPAVPTGVAAVYVAEDKSIDLSWQPNSEDDLAGYIVYRAENNETWVRISAEEPLSVPAFRDNAIQPGHTYRYTISAIDKGGHESQKSVEAAESVPRL